MLTMGDTINQHKSLEINVDYDAYDPLRGPNIPFQVCKSMIIVITRSDAQQKGLILL